MQLRHALRIQPGESIAFSGSGGKTSAIFALARQLAAPVIVTTTTHFSKDQLGFAEQIVYSADIPNIQGLSDIIEPGIVLIIGDEVENKRVSGVPGRLLAEIYQFTNKRGINLLIEADGSRQRALKAPAPHEPVIPSFVDHVVVVAGLSAIGKPLSAQYVHRPNRYAELGGLDLGEEISPQAIIRVLTDQMGGLKGIPEGARRVCVLNQADNEQLQAQGYRLAQALIPYYDSAIVASLLNMIENPGQADLLDGSTAGNGIFAVHEPVVGIILAAGGSHRMGRPKQLLPWQGKSLIRHVASNVLGAGLEKVMVVIGATGEQVRAELTDLPVEIVVNPNWELGQSTSIQAGLSAIPDNIGAAIFLLTDQPNVSRSLIRSMIERHATTLAPIIAPIVDGKRGNPVLFDRITFGDFYSIQGDTGGRELFSRYPISWIEWHDPAVLMDIDTDDDYQSLQSETT